jgi:hypothetical protein
MKAEFDSVRGEMKAEFDNVRGEMKAGFDNVNAEFVNVRGEMKAGFDNVNAEFVKVRGEMKAGFDNVWTELGELKIATLQMAARARNNNLGNPTLLIRSIPIFHQDHGIVHPDPARFPRHADEFYSLKTPQTERHRQILTYLAGFYDILQNASDASDASESDRSQSGGETRIDPERAVELLEDILGLQEHNFIAFRERARQFAIRSPAPPPKRGQPAANEKPQRRRRDRSPSDGTPTNLNTPTPPGGRPPRPRIVYPIALTHPLSSVSSHHGSTTNPNTPPDAPKAKSSMPDTEPPGSLNPAPKSSKPASRSSSMPDTEPPGSLRLPKSSKPSRS